MNDRTEQVDDLHLVALPSAIGCTEMFVRFALTEWALRGMRDVAAQVARALAGIVVSTADPAKPGMITARVRLSGGDLIIEIETARPVPPPQTPQGVRTGAMELEPGRHVVWCTLPLPGGMNAAAVPLPRRQRRPSELTAQGTGLDDPMTMDPEVMQRILYGLNGTQDRRDH
ncbi:ATP-binding protein [Actinokineospora sp.]|uniref:ATP-binding protein n=1 Tax=Actinokineospora sp. TaxID=1872133 RepID=UPI004038454F